MGVSSKKATTYVKRMQQKYANPKQQSRRQNIGRPERRLNALLAAEKRGVIWDDFNIEWKRQDEVIRELATKHKRKPEWMRRQLFRLSGYGQKPRAVNRWNAYLHIQSMTINDDLPPGEKLRLQDLAQKAKDASSWKEISTEDMDAMIRCLEEKRLLKKKGIRSQPRAHIQDVRQTAKRVQTELTNLGSRCATSSMVITVRTQADHANGPLYAVDETARDFIEVVLGIEFDDFCLKYEAYALCHIKGVAKTSNERKNLYKQRVRQLVRRGLRTITGNDKLEMSWKNYEDKIVAMHQVVLEGWPSDKFDPGELGEKEAKRVMMALEDGDCVWRRISDEELESREAAATAAGKVIKRRKERADKGKRRGTYKKVRRVDSDDEDDDDDGSSDEMRRTHRSQPLSAETIPSSDEEDDA